MVATRISTAASSGSARHSRWTCANLGCTRPGGAAPHQSGRADVGRGATGSAAGARARSIVGPLGTRRAARADVGLACAFALRSAPDADVGRAQAPGAAGAGRAWDRRAQPNRCALDRLGRAGPLLGCVAPRRTRRSARVSAGVGRRRSSVGRAEDRRARGAGSAFVVRPRRRPGAPADGTSSGAASSRTCARSAGVVAAGRATRPAQVPRASRDGSASGHGSASDSRTTCATSAVAAAPGARPSPGPIAAAGSRRGRDDGRAQSGRCARRRPRRHRPDAGLAAASGRARGPI